MRNYWSSFRRAIVIASIGLMATSCYQKADKEHSDIAGIIPQQDNDCATRTIEAKRMSGKNDTMLIYINESRFRVPPDGEIISPTGKKAFSIGIKSKIDKLYFLQKGTDIFLFISEKSETQTTSYAKRINVENGNIIWTAKIDGEAITRPTIKGQFAYIGAKGFIGKIKLKNGQYDWKYTSLNHDGRFDHFSDIDFINNHEVRYIAPHPYSMECDTVIINDITGEILKTN